MRVLTAALGLCVSALCALAAVKGDHQSHAVSGGPYNTFAAAGKAAFVGLDGSRSHSHYFTKNDTGRIVRYSWTVAGNEVCKEVKCQVEFAHGVTALNLQVEDQTGSLADAETTVSVATWELNGLRAWYFSDESGKASFSRSVPGVVGAIWLYPSESVGKAMQAVYFGGVRYSKGEIGSKVQYKGRCGFGVKGGWCYIGIGGAEGSIGEGAAEGLTGWMDVEKEVHDVYLSVMANSVGGNETFTLERRFMTNGTATEWGAVPDAVCVYLPRAYAPVINTAPTELQPGGVVKLTGTGFTAVGVNVTIGGVECDVLKIVNDDMLTCVVGGTVKAGEKEQLVVTSEVGTSNVKLVSVGAGAGAGLFQPVAFSESFLMGKTGEAHAINQATNVAIGPDGRYYFGSLDGFVHALTVDENYVVSDHCVSERVGELESVLGIGFNPAEHGGPIKVYATVNLLYYEERHGKLRADFWSNGRIVTFGVDVNKNCLGITNKALVSGLPVSNHDHGVNAIQFDDDGALFVAVGGSTNGGKSIVGDLIGGVADSPLSGAMLKIPVLKKGFNGTVIYSHPKRPDITTVKSGDVAAYAVGLRNVFNHVYHSNGKHYAMDNGANEGFGDFSTGCLANQTRPSKHDGDSLRLVTEGSYQGYPNMNRARKDKRQCVKYDLDSLPGPGYTPHIAYFESATVGLTEFTKNTFGGSMRGNLIATKFAIQDTGKTFRIVLTPDGTGVESQYELQGYSGLSAAETPYGGIVMPRVWQGKVAILAAKEKNPGMVAVSGVTPHRGPKAGGNTVIVTGWNFKKGVTVTFGGKPCTAVGGFAKSGRSFTCVAPAGVGKVPVVVTSGKKGSKSWGWEYSYMNV